MATPTTQAAEQAVLTLIDWIMDDPNRDGGTLSRGHVLDMLSSLRIAIENELDAESERS